MICPKCQVEMDKLSTPDAEVDRCSQCNGLWFDMLEHTDVKAIAKQIDIGDAATGEKFNKIDKISCPVCVNSALIRMVEAGQAHIWFESCPRCFGRFYDAGEFRDAAEFSLLDFFKQFSLKARN